MAVVAALFDSEADATKAMDRLLRENIKGLDTRVIDFGSRDNPESNLIFPVIPNTGSTTGQSGPAAPIGAIGNVGSDWLNDMDDVERQFYYDGMREGSTLALVKVPDEDVQQVRTLMSMFNARTYTKG